MNEWKESIILVIKMGWIIIRFLSDFTSVLLDKPCVFFPERGIVCHGD